MRRRPGFAIGVEPSKGSPDACASRWRMVEPSGPAGSGARPEDVVRTRMFISPAEHWDEVARAHGEIFASIRPASTCVVAGLLDPRWFVEIEADAILDS